MYMSRITLRPTAPGIELARISGGDAYADHRLLWTFFPSDGTTREFLYRRMEGRGRPSFLVVSPREPISPSPAWRVEWKRYEPDLRKGERLRFSLRANPVVRRRNDAGRQERHDVVMDAKRSLRGEAPVAAPTLAELVNEAGLSWLSARAEDMGFELERRRSLCHSYRQHRLTRRGRTIRFSSLDIEGALRVADPGRFVETLHRGIGPSKAFGCGCLLVKRL